MAEKLIRDAYNAAFREGMREHTSRNGGIPWGDSPERERGVTPILTLATPPADGGPR